MAFVTKKPVPYGKHRSLDIEVGANNAIHEHSYQIIVGDEKLGIVSHNTLSLLGACTPGCHPGIYPFYIRRIRMSSDTDLVDECKKHGYTVEPQMNFDGTIDRSTQIPCFPCKFPSDTVFAKDFSAIKQMDVVKRLQKEWSDNAVSCTVYYKPDELKGIRDYLDKNYYENFKSISFLLHQEHGFAQAPYEEITEEKYNDMMSKCEPISSVALKFSKKDDDIAAEPTCAGGVCPIK